MKPEGKSYEEPVIIPKVWELINGEHHLVPEKVSAHIRELEGKLAVRMQGKLPVWTNTGETFHLIGDKTGIGYFHKPPRKIWHFKSKRHRK